MPRLAHAHTNFTAGELSPRLDGRVDLAKYRNGVTNLENFLVHPHGGVTRRPGTEFIAEVKTSSLSTRIIPFEFNTEQVYLIEAGNQYMRFYKNGGQILNSGSIVEISTPYLTAELFELKFAQSADTMFIVHPNHAPRKLTRTSDVNWTLTEVVFEFGPFLDQNTTDTTITASARTGTVTLTASADTFVSTDVGRLVKIYDGFAKISAFTSATQVNAVVQANLDGKAELLPEYTATTISFTEGDPSLTGIEHNDRIVDSNKAFKDEGFAVGQKITISGTSSNNGTFLIAEVINDTILTAPSDDLNGESAGGSFTIVGTLEATDEWSLGAFSETTGFPGAICFYEERLVYAGTLSQPQTVFFSESGGFDQFNTGADDGDAMVFTLASSQVNVIRALVPSRTLIVLTTGAEFSAGSGSNLDPITPTNIQIKRQTTHGTANVSPVTAGSAVLFLQRAKRKIRELQFNFDVDGFIAPDMTILSEHVSEGGFIELALQQEPDNIIFAVRADGQLCGMTYRREEQVVAWHRHIVAGVSGAATITVTDFANIPTGTTLKLTKSDGTLVTFTSEAAGSSSPSSSLGFRPNADNNTTADNIQAAINAHADFTVANPAANVLTVTETARAGTGFLSIESSDTTRLATTNQANALVESVAVLPGDLDEDEVYVVVQRTINGATKRYIERLSDIDFGTSASDAFYVDSGLTYSGSAATTISGLTHLEGENVTILADGAAHPNKTVSSGAVTLDRSATKAHIGLGYTSLLKTMRIEGGSAQGVSQGAIKRIHDIVVRLFRTVGAKVGSSATNNDLIPFRSSADEMGQALDLFTGDKTIEFPNGYDTDAQVFVKQDQPLPMSVLGIYARLEVFDR